MAARFTTFTLILAAFPALYSSLALADERTNSPESPRPEMLKVHAQFKLGFSRDNNNAPLFSSENNLVVIRSSEELAANSDPKKAKDPEFQKQVDSQFTKLLKVSTIDWNRQMLVVVGERSFSAKSMIVFQSFSVKGKDLRVEWMLANEIVLNRGECHFTRGIALVDRFEGPVIFKPKE